MSGVVDRVGPTTALQAASLAMVQRVLLRRPGMQEELIVSGER